MNEMIITRCPACGSAALTIFSDDSGAKKSDRQAAWRDLLDYLSYTRWKDRGPAPVYWRCNICGTVFPVEDT